MEGRRDQAEAATQACGSWSLRQQPDVTKQELLFSKVTSLIGSRVGDFGEICGASCAQHSVIASEFDF